MMPCDILSAIFLSNAERAVSFPQMRRLHPSTRNPHNRRGPSCCFLHLGPPRPSVGEIPRPGQTSLAVLGSCSSTSTFWLGCSLMVARNFDVCFCRWPSHPCFGSREFRSRSWSLSAKPFLRSRAPSISLMFSNVFDIASSSRPLHANGLDLRREVVDPFSYKVRS